MKFIDNFTSGGSAKGPLALIAAMGMFHLAGTGMEMARSFIGLRFGGRLMGTSARRCLPL